MVGFVIFCNPIQGTKDFLFVYEFLMTNRFWVLDFELEKNQIGLQNVLLCNYKREVLVVDENRKLTRVGLGIK